MTAASTSPATKSTSSQVELIPWDPESPEHVERMVQQRIACGWKEKEVAKWRPLQREGRIALQWVVLSESDPDREEKLKKHVAAFPQEIAPLVDSAMSLGGKPRTPSLGEDFIPVGHISLNTEYEEPHVQNPGEGVYWIATFYISDALQGTGLGRASMDAVESMAASEPLCARALALSTAVEYGNEDPRWAALGKSPPKISTQPWYQRRGYEVYERVDRKWSLADPTGKKWWWSAVFMKKDI